MGIPGSVIDAILIGALMIHSIQPGPTLFLTNADVVWAMIAACLVANLLMYLMMTGMVGFVARLMFVPRAFILPVVMVFCVIGAYALDNTMFDVWVMLAFGLVGFFLERARVPLGPFVIGFVLAPLGRGQAALRPDDDRGLDHPDLHPPAVAGLPADRARAPGLAALRRMAPQTRRQPPRSISRWSEATCGDLQATRRLISSLR